GFYADLVLIDQEITTPPYTLLYKCGWSPFSNKTMLVSVSHTFVNGKLAYSREKGVESQSNAKPILFEAYE
ncbi:MAG: dihydroorotase, partial [Prevotellaceae bacterium]|nr:dihydroorotase [Prevotellaceae bacterium]